LKPRMETQRASQRGITRQSKKRGVSKKIVGKEEAIPIVNGSEGIRLKRKDIQEQGGQERTKKGRGTNKGTNISVF